MKEFFIFASNYPYLSMGVFVFVILAFMYFADRFSLKWENGKPIVEKRNNKEAQDRVTVLESEVAHLKEKLDFAHSADFFKKTENGEYIGYSVAKKPYIEIWCDGNWNTEEYHDEFDRFERLWDKENEIIIYGKNPNVTSDLHHIIEKKAKELDKLREFSLDKDSEAFVLSIYCGHSVAGSFQKIYKDFTNVKIVAR